VSAGVLVLHAWWGLNADVIARAERLRKEGYVVETPDLYGGEIATTIERATALRDALDARDALVADEVDRALTSLSERADRVAVIAWSLGAWYGWQLLDRRPADVAASVTYYGLGAVDPDKQLPPMLGHFAEDDEFEAVEDVRRTEAKLLASGRTAKFHVYPGTKHWFDEPSRPEYDARASALAWDRTLTFLEEHLRR
jgi:carboxymethylenebutenolidase